MLGETVAVVTFGFGHDLGLQVFARFDNEMRDFFCKVLRSVLTHSKVPFVGPITTNIRTLLEISAQGYDSFRRGA